MASAKTADLRLPGSSSTATNRLTGSRQPGRGSTTTRRAIVAEQTARASKPARSAGVCVACDSASTHCRSASGKACVGNVGQVQLVEGNDFRPRLCRRRCPLRRRVVEARQFAIGAAGCNPIAHVALGRADREVQRSAPIRRCRIASLATCWAWFRPRFVVVGQDNNLPASQKLRMLGGPLPGTAGVACGQHADTSQIVHVLFPFNDNHGPHPLGQQFRQSIGNHAHPFDRPPPTAAGFGLPLFEFLRFKPYNLEQ